jgi:hypothetical protein
MSQIAEPTTTSSTTPVTVPIKTVTQDELVRQVFLLTDQLTSLQQQLYVQRASSSSKSSENSLKPNKPNTYDGQRKHDLDSWISEVTRYFKACGIETINLSEKCVPYAVSLLRGDASIWWENHQTMIRTQELEAVDKWLPFIEAIRLQFQPANKSQVARDMLAKLVQIKSVLQYTSDFNRLSIRIDNLHHTEQLDRYIRGLKAPIRIEVQKCQPGTFMQAVSIAEQIDNILWQNRTIGQNNTRYPRASQSNQPTPMDISQVEDVDSEVNDQKEDSEVNVIQGSRPRLNLPKDEYERRKKNNLCLKCGKPGHRIAQCRVKVDIISKN